MAIDGLNWSPANLSPLIEESAIVPVGVVMTRFAWWSVMILTGGVPVPRVTNCGAPVASKRCK